MIRSQHEQVDSLNARVRNNTRAAAIISDRQGIATNKKKLCAPQQYKRAGNIERTSRRYKRPAKIIGPEILSRPVRIGRRWR